MDRLLNKISPEPNSGCWLWTGSLFRGTGYGQFWMNGTNKLAHRVVYELYKGPIPEGLELDHKCRMKVCVNPEHLEPVTSRVNQLRGHTISARNVAKTHCAKGHDFGGDNLWMRANGWRVCKECNRQAQKRYLRRKND